MNEYEEWCPDHDQGHCRALIKLEERIEAIEARFRNYDEALESRAQRLRNEQD